jgi:hypothetical protein
MRVCAVNGTNVALSAATSRSRMPYCSFASTTMLRPSGVSSARELSCAASASARLRAARGGQKRGGLPVAQRDGARLVEEEHVDVARRFDGAPARGDDVRLNHPVHAGDADGRQEAADRRGNEAHEERDEHRDRDGGALLGGLDAVKRKRKQRHCREKKDDGERREQDIERDLVRSLLPLGPSTMAIMRSRNVSPGLAVM